MTRKSKPPVKQPNGNAVKYLSYREAWARIKQAREQEFHLEAITLLESIISDRLIAYLVVVGELDPTSKNGKGKHLSLKSLIDRWRKQHPEPIVIGKSDNLQNALDGWRVQRNRAVHEIVRVEDGATALHLDEFLENAVRASKEGEALAKALSSWCQKMIRSISAASPTAISKS